MAAGETGDVARTLSATPSLSPVMQLDRVGKGALSYVLVSDGDAVVIDPGRHLARYDAVLAELRATPAAVVDTPTHVGYVSGGHAGTEELHGPLLLHSHVGASTLR